MKRAGAVLAQILPACKSRYAGRAPNIILPDVLRWRKYVTCFAANNAREDRLFGDALHYLDIKPPSRREEQQKHIPGGI